MKVLTRSLFATAIAGSLLLAACGGGGGGGGGNTLPQITPTPFSTPTPPPTPSPTTVLCTTAGAPQSFARTMSLATSAAEPGLRRQGVRHQTQGALNSQHLLVVYDRSKVQMNRTIATKSLHSLGADLRSEIDLSHVGKLIRVLSVQPGQNTDAVMRQLRSQSGVLSVERDVPRYAQSTTALFTNDPYFVGATGAQTPPFYQKSSTGGQWDMHVICAANAWGYSTTNSTGRTVAAAAGGSTTVPIAVIDTGADLTHPELSGRATVTEIIDSGDGTISSTSASAMHDNDGHGTNVAGIAAGSGNNGIGFSGVAYKVKLQIYKVFPDPPSGCNTNTNSTACDVSAAGGDEIKAINEAVSHGAKVINLSLGSSGTSTAEQTAVENAITAGVVVVAASGNGNSAGVGQSSLDCPACYSGVVAVGASALDDSGASVVEKVASYSNYDSAHPSSWGIVAPGGDPSNNDSDLLHWIENIYTSTPADVAFQKPCTGDFGTGSTLDCRILIAGTSQATPHVSGAAALLISAGASASSIRSLLCTTAKPISSTKAGCGRLNVYKAMASVVGDPSP